MYKLVLSCLLAAASAAHLSPFAYTAPLAYAAPFYTPYNYRGPLSLAPGQPANILGADGRPLDTLDVNLDKSAHFTAKALAGHYLKKRSAVFAAPLAYSAPIAYATPFYAPNNYRGPLSLAPGQPANILAADGRPLDTLDVNLDRAAHLTAKAFSGHYLKKRSAPVFSAPIIAPGVAIAHGPVVASAPLAYSAYSTPIVSHYASPLSYAAPFHYGKLY